jgi:hypothetical protein
MSNALPIACTLDAAEHAQREADLRSLGRDGLVAVERGERQVILRFRPDPVLRARVEDIAAAESTCCAFLVFEVLDEDGRIALRVTAPEGGEQAMHDLASLIVRDAGAAAEG